MLSKFTKRLQGLSRQQRAVAAALLTLAGAALYGLVHISGATHGHSEVSSQSRKGLQRYTPTPAEWASLTIEPVTERSFRAETVTEGKIAVDEDRSTPVFSPYAGRVTKLLVRPGDTVTQQQPLFVIEVGARSRAAAIQARQGPVRGQGGSAQGLSAGRGNPDPGAERPALDGNRTGGVAQQIAYPWVQRRGDLYLSGKRPH
jgi:multidrug efflux pump subunit AcrA (membrane-fusion protein)